MKNTTTGRNTKTIIRPCIITLHNNVKADWNIKIGCRIGSRAQASLDDCSWSRSQKLLHGGAEGWTWDLSSGYTVQICGASELTYCGTNVVCFCVAHIISSCAWSSERGCISWILKFEKCFSFASSLYKITAVCPWKMLFKYIILRHLIYTGVVMQLFSVFNVPNQFGSRIRAKTLDAWSQRRSLNT